jgi:2-C-methyl-D-erythritol 2,4-cyclodiphosphate synthase
MRYRIGIGFDAHKFMVGRKLFLGGVEISHPVGLHGHSDADVLLHALTDALLGAAGLGDIGMHFPDSDPRWKDASSTIFVHSALEEIYQLGWKISNIDLTIIAQEPKIGPHRRKILENVCVLLELPKEVVNLKAKTTDHLGFTGRGEGIAAQAVVLLENDATP